MSYKYVSQEMLIDGLIANVAHLTAERYALQQQVKALQAENQIKDAAVEGAIRRAERAEAKNAGRIDGDLGYGWICPFCGVPKDEGQQTGVYWYRKPVCGECAPKLSAMRLEHLGEDDHGRSK